MHRLVDPAILYFGTPVVLVSSTNEDGSTNVAPMSSAWWLGQSCLLGFGARSQTPANILRTGECVLNLPSVTEVGHVDRLAKTTGSNPVPPHKTAMGYRHEPDKLGCGGRVHVDESLLVEGQRDRIDPDRWRPLVMSFCQFYGLGERVHPSRLAEIPESAYRPQVIAVPSPHAVPAAVLDDAARAERVARLAMRRAS